jgi:hypothetical protein
MRVRLAALTLLVAAAAVSEAQIRNGELGYTLIVPKGFVAYPAGKSAPDIVDCWIEERPADGNAPITLCIQRLRSTLSREPMTPEQLGSPNLTLTSFKWLALDIEGVESIASPENGHTVSFVAQVPLAKEAIQLIVRGPQSQRTRARTVLSTTLVSLVGDTNWLTPLQRVQQYAARYRQYAEPVAGGLAALAVIWLLLRRRRRAALAEA